MIVDVVIPALNEEGAIAQVVQGLVRTDLIRDVWVVDNASTDNTAFLAREAGAQVVYEPRRGYGQACLLGLEQLAPGADVVAFIDADGSDGPAEIVRVLEPILKGRADFVVGSRALGPKEAGSITPQQVIGNAIASAWLRWRFDQPATDLGPFRAIRKDKLDALQMTDTNYGWTIEMQIKAARHHLRYEEVPVSYACRVGESKVSGTVRGTFGAAYKILGLLALYDFWKRSE
ncbi:MAG: glycosyltransferase family 2 protein [Deltaproteobacteria bacterium]|nr:glycosyltransferase family 2 protein [Deltaproteobacteria bacterium]